MIPTIQYVLGWALSLETDDEPLAEVIDALALPSAKGQYVSLRAQAQVPHSRWQTRAGRKSFLGLLEGSLRARHKWRPKTNQSEDLMHSLTE